MVAFFIFVIEDSECMTSNGNVQRRQPNERWRNHHELCNVCWHQTWLKLWPKANLLQGKIVARLSDLRCWKRQCPSCLNAYLRTSPLLQRKYLSTKLQTAFEARRQSLSCESLMTKAEWLGTAKWSPDLKAAAFLHTCWRIWELCCETRSNCLRIFACLTFLCKFLALLNLSTLETLNPCWILLQSCQYLS